MDKAALLAEVRAALNRIGGSVSVSPWVRDGATGDEGDRGARAGEELRVAALNAIGTPLDTQLQALAGVDPSPATVVRVGALVRVAVSPGAKEERHYLILPCSCPPWVVVKHGGITIIPITPECAVGTALMHRMAGEVVRAATPQGISTMRILGVE